MWAPDLSIVIPALNEAAILPGLLESLSRQEDVRFEIVVADGGSRDGSPEACRSAASRLTFPIRVVETAPGRGRQMNVGARGSRAPDLLFLHADTTIADPRLLARARERMDSERQRLGTKRSAGHFGLRFFRLAPGREAVYYFYEAKTRLNRPGCVNGDQGFWLAREYFDELGEFDESLPYMEDARLAEKVFDTGTWIELPGTLGTSARRFETEGLWERQLLNALLRNFDAIGLPAFFQSASEAYREQRRADLLRLGPFLRIAHRLVFADGIGEGLSRWFRTGRHVAANGWQLAFAFDCARNRRKGHAPGDGPREWLGRFDRRLVRVFRSPVVAAIAGLSTAAVFYSALALTAGDRDSRSARKT